MRSTEQVVLPRSSSQQNEKGDVKQDETGMTLEGDCDWLERGCSGRLGRTVSIWLGYIRSVKTGREGQLLQTDAAA